MAVIASGRIDLKSNVTQRFKLDENRGRTRALLNMIAHLKGGHHYVLRAFPQLPRFNPLR
jgi:hypothetical protein